MRVNNPEVIEFTKTCAIVVDSDKVYHVHNYGEPIVVRRAK